MSTKCVGQLSHSQVCKWSIQNARKCANEMGLTSVVFDCVSLVSLAVATLPLAAATLTLAVLVEYLTLELATSRAWPGDGMPLETAPEPQSVRRMRSQPRPRRMLPLVSIFSVSFFSRFRFASCMLCMSPQKYTNVSTFWN